MLLKKNSSKRELAGVSLYDELTCARPIPREVEQWCRGECSFDGLESRLMPVSPLSLDPSLPLLQLVEWGSEVSKGNTVDTDVLSEPRREAYERSKLLERGRPGKSTSASTFLACGHLVFPSTR